MGTERTRRRAAVGQLQDRGLDLDEVLAVEHGAEGAQDGGLGARHDRPGLGVDDHVHVAEADPGLVGEGLVLVRERAQRLHDHLPGGDPHGQLAAAVGDHLALHRDQVADVDEVLELVELLLADVGEGEHDLEPAPSSRRRTKQSLPVLREEDHAARDGHLVTGAGVRLELAPLHEGVELRGSR